MPSNGYASSKGYSAGSSTVSGIGLNGYPTYHSSSLASYPASNSERYGFSAQAPWGYPRASHPSQDFTSTDHNESAYLETSYPSQRDPVTDNRVFRSPYPQYNTSFTSAAMQRADYAALSNTVDRSRYRMRDELTSSAARPTGRRASLSPTRDAIRSDSTRAKDYELQRARQRVYYHGSASKTKVPEAYNLVREHELRQLELGATPRGASLKYHKVLGISSPLISSPPSARFTTRPATHSTQQSIATPSLSSHTYTTLRDYDPDFFEEVRADARRKGV